MEEICLLTVRLASRVALRSLTLLKRETEIPATSTQVMWSREKLRLDVPRRISLDLSGFNASPLCTNQE